MIFPKGLDFGLQGIKGFGGPLEGGAALTDALSITLLLAFQCLLTALQLLELRFSLLEPQHLFLQAAPLETLLSS